MTLSFSQKYPQRMGDLAGQPNYFVQKIWTGLTPAGLIPDELFDSWYDKVEEYGINLNIKTTPKFHTIREDKSNRWKDGNDIHFVINNRTKDRFQFAPIIKCKGIQYISITYIEYYPIVYLGNTQESWMPFYWENPYDNEDGYGVEQMKELAVNDGFNSIEDFFKYFDSDFTGKIIHWTNLKY